MNAVIPTKVRSKLTKLSRMKVCERRNEGGCMGVLEWHHTISGTGRKKLQEEWSIIALCTQHHRGILKDDAKARHIAYSYATDDDLSANPKTRDIFKQEKLYLSKKYVPFPKSISTNG